MLNTREGGVRGSSSIVGTLFELPSQLTNLVFSEGWSALQTGGSMQFEAYVNLPPHVFQNAPPQVWRLVWRVTGSSALQHPQFRPVIGETQNPTQQGTEIPNPHWGNS